ncbi:hypothetical protein KJ652_02635 [Patescibacteria group bacterium]|nr:hypothetical protein [Patescibacteria group bacterium]MBU1123463.1 hypothetical protein [Patescibacteria group bacterium]MBU1911837.1 hypothetical protein [Patescibacteria group bacterium]
MSSLLSIDELTNMQLPDLLREIKEQSSQVAKMRLGIKMNKEKDNAKYKREKKQLARMQTVLTEKSKEDIKIGDVDDSESGKRNPVSGKADGLSKNIKNGIRIPDSGFRKSNSSITPTKL